MKTLAAPPARRAMRCNETIQATLASPVDRPALSSCARALQFAGGGVDWLNHGAPRLTHPALSSSWLVLASSYPNSVPQQGQIACFSGLRRIPSNPHTGHVKVFTLGTPSGSNRDTMRLGGQCR